MLGPRPRGKSTLIKEFLKDIDPARVLSLDLLRNDVYVRYLAEPSLFRKEIENKASTLSFVFVDEIQRLPDLLNEVDLMLESAHPPCIHSHWIECPQTKARQSQFTCGQSVVASVVPSYASGRRSGLCKSRS